MPRLLTNMLWRGGRKLISSSASFIVTVVMQQQQQQRLRQRSTPTNVGKLLRREENARGVGAREGRDNIFSLAGRSPFSREAEDATILPRRTQEAQKHSVGVRLD